MRGISKYVETSKALLKLKLLVRFYQWWLKLAGQDGKTSTSISVQWDLPTVFISDLKQSFSFMNHWWSDKWCGEI